ncbi:MAG: fumarylacetoacetate hydrolase family protein [Promethearchaeota archaeon]
MRLASIEYFGEENLALQIGVKFCPLFLINEQLSLNLSTTMDELLKNGQIDSLTDWYNSQKQTLLQDDGLLQNAIPISSVKFLPLYNFPPKIWGIGLNYKDHALDLNEKAPQSIPASFMKAQTTIIGAGDNIRIPLLSERTTGEAELGIVIKKPCRDIPREDWLSVVAGFTCILDMTAEDILRKNPRYLTLSKNFDSFFSFGPVLITPDEISNVEDLNVATVINGEVHGQNSVKNMTFLPDFLISFHSQVMTLIPGDIISTGTPRAVLLKHGDMLECRIDSFPALKNPVIDLKIKKGI